MREPSYRSFGLLIAYLLPGFLALWAVQYFSPTIESWLAGANATAPTVGGFLYLTLASVGAGMTVSAIRWAVAAAGVDKPADGRSYPRIFGRGASH